MPAEETELQMLEPKKIGLVVVLAGRGKGKTTSALGMALRAVGHGMKACITHFIKGDIHSGEHTSVHRLAPYAELHLTGKGLSGIQGNPYPYKEHRANAQQAMQVAEKKISSRWYHLIILDEISSALKLKLVDFSQVINLIDHKPPLMHMVLTGRDAHEEVIKRAYTVSEVKEIRHAYRQGIEPPKGIDY